MAIEVPAARLATLLQLAPHCAVAEDIARDWSMSEAEAGALFDQLSLIRIPCSSGQLLMPPPEWLRLRRGVADSLKDFHQAYPERPGEAAEALR